MNDNVFLSFFERFRLLQLRLQSIEAKRNRANLITPLCLRYRGIEIIIGNALNRRLECRERASEVE